MTIRPLNELGREAAQISANHGFSSGVEDIDQKLLLAVGEIVEAQNELRTGHTPQEVYFNAEKPEGFGVEIADAIIRLAQLTFNLDIDLYAAIALKMRYNDTRPYKHGKQF